MSPNQNFARIRSKFLADPLSVDVNDIDALIGMLDIAKVQLSLTEAAYEASLKAQSALLERLKL